MVCPGCENGKVFHPMAHVRASKDFGKFSRCRRCNGSGITYCRGGEEATYDTDAFCGHTSDLRKISL